MKFCAIGPMCVKEEVLAKRDAHMVLAQYLYDQDYYNFYRQEVLAKKMVILDSGVYEGAAVSERELLYWCKKLQPSYVVLPDKPNDFAETLKRSIAFADKLIGLEVKPLKVLHAESLEEFIASYIYDSRLFGAVGFSRLTPSFSSKVALSRALFIKHLKQGRYWNPLCYHHALGMINGSLAELGDLKNAGIDSCDSSAPIWRGLYGCRLGINPHLFNIDFDPFAQIPIYPAGVGMESTVETVDSNLSCIDAICQASE